MYCNRRNFRARFNFIYFVLLAESTKISSIQKPWTYLSVSDNAFAERKIVVYENSPTPEYEMFMHAKISAIAVPYALINHSHGNFQLWLHDRISSNETNIQMDHNLIGLNLTLLTPKLTP